MEVFISKIESLERCLGRVREEYGGIAANLIDITKQDAIVLNLQRACEQAIDLADLVIARKRYETPKSSRQAFDILQRHGEVDAHLADRLKKMVGFRNIAVHEYQKIDAGILQSIIERDLTVFFEFAERIRAILPELGS